MKKIFSMHVNRKVENNEDASRRYGVIKSKIKGWIESKGGYNVFKYKEGEFTPKYGGVGVYEIVEYEEVESGLSYTKVLLEEEDNNNNKVETIVDIYINNNTVNLYIEIRFGTEGEMIGEEKINIKTPIFFKDIIKEGEWCFGGDIINNNYIKVGENNFNKFFDYLVSPRRRLPVLVVSGKDGAKINYKSIFYDVMGLCNVFVLNNDSAWDLTYKVGKMLSCYNGAARIYFNKFDIDSDPYKHPLFLYEKYYGRPDNIRRRIMHYYSIVLSRPKIVKDMSKKALVGCSDYIKFLESEVDRLEQELEQKRKEYNDIYGKYIYYYSALMSDSSEIVDIDMYDRGSPKRGEERFYKKVYSNKKYDIMVERGDCGHNVWQNAHGADKAKKGIAKLVGRSNWQNIWHCGKCTGGGVYKVKW